MLWQRVVSVSVENKQQVFEKKKRSVASFKIGASLITPRKFSHFSKTRLVKSVLSGLQII